MSSNFVAKTQNLLYFHPSLLKSYREFFRDFHDFTLKCASQLQLSLVPQEIYIESVKESWCSRTKQFLFLGSRLTKLCRKCKIYEHHGYWSVDGKRHFNRGYVLSEFLLSSEDTAFQMDVLAQCNNILVIGAVPFSTYAASYNRRFQYSKIATTNDIGAKVNRMKRYVDNIIAKVKQPQKQFSERVRKERHEVYLCSWFVPLFWCSAF